MKKITLSAFAVITVALMTSCAKNYTCTCTSTTTYAGVTTPASTTTTVINKVTKSQATQGACASGTTTDATGAVTTNNCTVN